MEALGANVIAGVGSDDKKEWVINAGADHVINYNTEDIKQRIGQITDNKFVDVIYELVGGDVFDKCLRCMGDQGRLLVVGFASGKIPSIPANLPLVKIFSVIGVASGESMRRHPELVMVSWMIAESH